MTNTHTHESAIKDLTDKNCKCCSSRKCDKCAIQFAVLCIRRDISLGSKK